MYCNTASTRVRTRVILAPIVAEIHAPDVAAGDVGGAGVVAGSDDDDALFGSVHRHAEDNADLFD